MPMLRDAIRLDAIKKAARREAWYHNNDPDNRTYNFFGRMNAPPRKRRDEECGTFQHSQTENDVESPIEKARRDNNAAANAPYARPQKSATFPDQPSLPHNESSLARSEDVMSDDTLSPQEPGVSASSTHYSSQATVTEQSNGPARKRRLRKFMLCGKKDDEEPDNNGVKRTDTSSSKKRPKRNPNMTVWSQLKAVFGSFINVLLVAVPAGIVIGNMDNVSGVAKFVVNFIAIIPLAGMLSYGTEELAMYVGETLGGLLNATFGNAVELIVSIIALIKGEVIIVQTSLIGSMLSNLLLVLGMCFFFGGLRRTEQFFNITVAQTAASLLALAIGSLIIPTAFSKFSTIDSGVAPISRGTSVLLLILYVCYLFFQLSTHVDMYNEPSKKVPKRPSKSIDAGDTFKRLAVMGAGTGAAATGGQVNQENLVRKGEAEDDDDDEETPNLSLIGAFITLAGSTVLVAFCAEYLVDGIGSIAHSVSPEFVGLILLPIVGNAAEHATAVTVAIKDKMDLAIGVAVGSSLQIALLVLPFTVLLSWFGVGASHGQVMTLNFDGFLITVIFVAMIEVNYLIQDGKSHWLEGVMLMTTYVVIALAAFFYPTNVNFAGA